MPGKLRLKKNSFIDFPGRISAVLFLPGCNLRCPWCHNGELATGQEEDLVEAEAALAYISKRRSILGGVVISGGEPCLCGELPELIREIKKTSLPVKLDTNGMFPAVLEELLSREETRPDYISLDLKLSPSRYVKLLPEGGAFVPVAAFDPAAALSQSASLISGKVHPLPGVAHEYRSLALPGGFFAENDIEALAPLADNSPWYFRPFRGGNCLDPSWDALEETPAEARVRTEALAKKAVELGKNGIAR